MPEAADARHREFLKENALRLADAHRNACASHSREVPPCSVSLIALAELLREAGFDLTEDEIRRLM